MWKQTDTHLLEPSIGVEGGEVASQSRGQGAGVGVGPYGSVDLSGLVALVSVGHWLLRQKRAYMAALEHTSSQKRSGDIIDKARERQMRI